MNQDNLSIEQKINEIYAILHKQEARRRAGLWYVWLKRIVIYGFIAFTFFYPGKVYQAFMGIIGPLIKTQVEQMLNDKKDTTMNSIRESIQKMQESLQTQPPTQY